MTLSTLKHWTKLALRSEYRDYYYSIQQELNRIKNAPRYTHLSTNLLGSTLTVIDGLSFTIAIKRFLNSKSIGF